MFLRTIFERLANYISQERENNLLEEKHLEYFKRNQNDFVFNMTKSIGIDFSQGFYYGKPQELHY